MNCSSDQGDIGDIHNSYISHRRNPKRNPNPSATLLKRLFFSFQSLLSSIIFLYYFLNKTKNRIAYLNYFINIPTFGGLGKLEFGGKNQSIPFGNGYK